MSLLVFLFLLLAGGCESLFLNRPRLSTTAAVAKQGERRPACSRLLSRKSAPSHDENKNNKMQERIWTTTSRRTACSLMVRQAVGLSTVVFTASTGAVQPAMAAAAAPPAKNSQQQQQQQADKIKLYKGYERLNYLLDNWVKETTVCGVSDNPYVSEGGCERTPMKVMDYLGYRNINDPLFRADKTMRRLEDLVPSDRQVEYLEAIEKWVEAAEEGSGMAYISSWGEANPGGGKDRVALFIERAKKNVMDSRDGLATVIEILEIQKPS